MPSIASVTYGPIFIGVIFNVLLYGIMITQTYLYFNVYKKDRLWMKLFVGLLFLCDTLNCAFDIAFVYIPLVNNFGNDLALTSASWVFATGSCDPVMTAVIGSLVQSFFAWRVKVLTNSIPAVAFIATCALVQFCGGLGTSIAVGMIPQFAHFQNFEVIVIIWLAFSAVADCAITAALVWHLRKHKTGFAATDDIVNRIIRLTVQTGLITALCALIDLILFVATPSGLHLLFNLPLSKLYTNSLMSSLNSRSGWRYNTGSGESTSDEISRTDHGRHLNVRSETGRRVSMMPPNQVYIDVESHEMVDVLDGKVLPAGAAIASMPTKTYNEKSGQLSPQNASDSF